jgi:hypothetical protein
MALNHDGTPFTPMSPDLVGGGIEITHAQNCNYALADGFHRLARKDNTFPLFLRYKIQTERLYRRAVEEFDRLKALRPELPNEAILEAQPEENEPTYAPPDEPISTPQREPQAPNAAGLSTSEDAARNVLQDLDVPAGHDNFLVGQAVSPVTAGRAGAWLRLRCSAGQTPRSAAERGAGPRPAQPNGAQGDLRGPAGSRHNICRPSDFGKNKRHWQECPRSDSGMGSAKLAVISEHIQRSENPMRIGVPLLTIAALAMFAARNAPAQINSGVITGLVTDPQKAAVPNAKVEVVEDSTKFSYSATTNSSGEFTAPYLKAGVYTVTVTAAGFPVFRLTDVNVITGSTVRTDVALQLSKVATEVQVSAAADQLQSDSTATESAVSDHVIDSIPNATQNPLYYATLLEGVVGRAEMGDSTAFQSFGIGYDGRRWQSALNVNGASAFTASIQLDGLSVTSGAWNEAAVLPNTDSLQEVRVVTSNFTAEQSRGMGAIKMSTKSGTNQWHGSAHDIVRNEAFNANTFKNNANAIARAAFRVNDFGGTIGGPIIKDKLFIFTSYAVTLHKDSPQWLWTVPTAAQRTGDFSQTVISGTNGAPTPAGIYDPASVTQTSATVYTRDPYPNNIIPNPSSYALKIMNVYPLPNRTPTDAFGANNFFAQAGPNILAIQ